MYMYHTNPRRLLFLPLQKGSQEGRQARSADPLPRGPKQQGRSHQDQGADCIDLGQGKRGRRSSHDVVGVSLEYANDRFRSNLIL